MTMTIGRIPRLALPLLFGCLPLLAPAQDTRSLYLEQEVRRLQQELQSISRRVDELERPALVIPNSPPRASAPTPSSDTWLDAGKWRKVRAGMSELEVIALLGPPTSLREENGERVLFYAMEIGSSGFLGGSIKLRERIVSEVRQPTLQ